MTTTSTPKVSGRVIAAITAGGVAVAGIVAAVALTVGAPTATATTTPSTPSTPTTPVAPSNGGGSHHQVTPSAATKKLQTELAQLNYYEGPITGYWNSETTSAIENLQASAGLPRTGTMNAATQKALDYQLVHGDNQMGGNTNTPASASITKLQTELAQLNYYDGTVTGHWNAATTSAIENLQRAAGLEQTGQLNTATQQALTYQLAHGDNQMNS